MDTWMVRPNPDGNRITEFLQNDMIAIGWPDTGDLSGKSSADIKSALVDSYQYSGADLGSRLSSVDIFVNKMNAGDLVLVPDDSNIHFAEITGDYSYVQTPGQEAFPHQRTVRWLTKTARTDLSNALRASLKDRRTVGNFSHHAQEIENLSNGLSYDPPQTAIDVSYPLRPDWVISFQVPADITRQEAERLATHLGTLYFSA